MTERQWKILVVDDIEQNVSLLTEVLSLRGYAVVTATNGVEALERVRAEQPNLVLLDVVMPQMDGYETVRRLRADEATRFLPVIMVTSLHASQEKVKAIEAGADDFINKPFNQHELLSRVKSLLRIKEYHDTIESQAAQLTEWNRTLETRVQEQVEEIGRINRLRQFLAPQIAEMIVSGKQEKLLDTHRREIAVVFCDLRGFTSFSETTEPEEIMAVLNEFHRTMGELVFRYEGTLEYIAGDGMNIFFNDPIPCPDPAERAVRMAVEMRAHAGALIAEWKKRGHDLGFGVGVSLGYATLGIIGFESCVHYGSIGAVVNLAQRLCSEAKAGQILISPRVQSAVENVVNVEPIAELTLKGFSRPVAAYNIMGIA